MSHRQHYKSIEGATIIEVGDGASEIINYTTESGRFASVCFRGRTARRATFAHSFNDEFSRERFQSNWIAEHMKVVAEKQERLKAKKAIDLRRLVEVGDVFVNVWGWEQTNVDFFGW